MNCETCFIAESFKLPGTGFHQTEFRGEPGSRVGEGNCFGFYGCKLVKAGGQNVVVVVSEIRGAMEVHKGSGGYFFREGG